MTATTAIAQRPERFIANLYNPRIAVNMGADGFAHQVCEWVRLFADTDLYSAKQPNYDLWGPGVAKVCKALGARVTPLMASPDPVSGHLKPGFRVTYDEQSGAVLKVEQDVLLECRHPKTGSPIHILATGEVDVWHAYLAEMAKLCGGQRDDVAAIVSTKVKDAMQGDGEHDSWAFYPYSFGSWLAINLSNRAVQEAQGKLREMGRPDKVRGFATSKGARLALKQSNLVPMRFNSRSFLKDAAGRDYIDLPVISWIAYDSREKMQQAIDNLLAQHGDTVEATWEAVSDSADPFKDAEQDTEPERAAMAEEALAIEQQPDEVPAPPVREPERVQAQPAKRDEPKAKQQALPVSDPEIAKLRAEVQRLTEIAGEGAYQQISAMLNIREESADADGLRDLITELKAVAGE